MKIAVMGSGGVGGYFGARLATAGNDVTFIARGAHLAAMRSDGLRVQSARGDIHLSPVTATDDPNDVGPVDIVLFATKLYDTESAGELCKPFIGRDTAVISLLNGVDSEEQLSRILGAEHVVGGVARISAGIAAPGVIQHHSDFAIIEFGELDGRPSARLEKFHATAREAGIDALLRDDIIEAIWEKFVMLASFSAITALTRLPIGPIRDTPETWRLVEAAIHETAAVGRAKGVSLAEDLVDDVLRLISGLPIGKAAQGSQGGLPDGMKSSMLMDLERGNRLELEWLSGAVCRLGRETGVETPVHDVVLAALLPFAKGSG
ncbi:MAG: 2-dehydropantoate 2-reductase [Gammaproteobacteria bacterium]|nr:2-dehydropantoate 2-reductase [Gammaproteobacteria bacterium]NIV49712.1 2-dehydropantoate 2-reductase [Gammaproteobacteria bacterium]NIW57110.1 2-dehydropantoate 2-reductase [Gammaproteobacteria bacterium]